MRMLALLILFIVTQPVFGQEISYSSRIGKNNIKELDKWARDSTHEFYYPRLLKQFKEHPDSLSLDAMFMVYYGFTTTPEYSPYKRYNELEGIREATPEKRFEACKKVLQIHPAHLDSWYYLASGDGSNPEVNMARYIYSKLMASIIATGSGKSEAEAIVVISASDEYNVIGWLGYRSTMQSLLNKDNHNFDLLSGINKQQEKREFYFNIDKPFGSLTNSFKSESKNEEISEKPSKKRRKN